MKAGSPERKKQGEGLRAKEKGKVKRQKDELRDQNPGFKSHL